MENQQMNLNIHPKPSEGISGFLDRIMNAVKRHTKKYKQSHILREV